MNGKLEFFSYKSYYKDTHVDFHQHNCYCYELVYYSKGIGQMKLNGETLNYTANSMTLTRPNYMHDETHEEATDVIFLGFLYDDFPVQLINGMIHDSEKKEILKLCCA